MSKFTYLLGAGASIGSIPIISGFIDGLQDFAKFHKEFSLESELYESKSLIVNDLAQSQKEFVSKILDLCSRVNDHASIDTLAKKYYLRGDIPNLLELKTIINEFLIYRQLRFGLDKRYDAFFSAIISNNQKGGIELPDNINIISWNYDRQVEFSLGQFHEQTRETTDLNHIEKISKIAQVIPNALNNFEFNPDKFSLIKLNGSVGHYFDGTSDENMRTERFNVNLTKEYYSDQNNLHYIAQTGVVNFEKTKSRAYSIGSKDTPLYDEPFISYSWENTKLNQNIRTAAKKAVSDTEYLVVIGYSFPVYNRRIDKEIIDSMRPTKVFIQNHRDYIDGVVSRFRAFSKVEVEPIKTVDEFYIPFEYDFPEVNPGLTVSSF
ncbi:hypothetical protein [uncultured Imperialibacter sp.]|uniref:hypothetical protein n=1 Tax=uncultured Imperialibacter sp. TaxID=1672639 RepID=UPI0030DC17BC|tara:strand:+ start:6842 stop:7975 length:1134 start_codon:yes stop_codon:yes gene_type:complete